MYESLSKAISAVRSGGVQLEAVLVKYGGVYHYKVDTDSGQVFSDGTVKREGFVFVLPAEGPLGDIVVELYGLRVASSTMSQPRLRMHNPPLAWTGNGVATAANNSLIVLWRVEGADEFVEDKLEIRGEPEKPCPGVFLSTQGALTTQGNVCYQKISPDGDVNFKRQLKQCDMRLVIPEDKIAEWGQRVYDTFDAADRAKSETESVLVDIVYGVHELIDRKTQTALRQEYLTNGRAPSSTELEQNRHYPAALPE